MNSLKEFECYDSLLIKPFSEIGWKVDTVSWRNTNIEWNNYKVVIIRSCWDYQQAPVQFMRVLRNINESSALLVNSLNLVEWNINKRYLKELKNRGVKIVPTFWEDEFSSEKISKYFSHFKTDKLILKPTVGAGAENAFCLKREEGIRQFSRLDLIFEDQSLLVQPFIENVIDEGEFSLFYFGGSYSHAILKTPEAGDFRVQEEHGGRLQRVEADEKLLQAAQKTMKSLPEEPLYVRFDFIRNNEEVLLIEVELIEPSLYFNMDTDSKYRFTRAFEQWWNESKKSI